MESFLLREKAESSKQPGIPSVPNEEFDPANIPEMGDHGRVCFEQSARLHWLLFHRIVISMVTLDQLH